MKKIIIVLMCIFPMITKAQKYYEPEELEITWRYWTEQYGWDYLIGNGKKLTYSCIPNLDFPSIGLSNYNEIVTTYCHRNKFIVLTFNSDTDSRYGGIRLRYGTYSRKNMSSLLSSYTYLRGKLWYEIDFENIIYEPTFDRIMIPIGQDENGYFNAICIDFKWNTRVSIPDMGDNFDESKTKYYNLKGEQIDAENVSDGIIIKTDGKKTSKILK